jgi:hypothetical protein
VTPAKANRTATFPAARHRHLSTSPVESAVGSDESNVVVTADPFSLASTATGLFPHQFFLASPVIADETPPH